tara:strand:+ start:715 stop:1632 length:918 start_codon:yes stop_codon:yes gene_type:complete
LKNSILFITGPTAIGKSELAIRLSKEINGEIINADSMQIYKELKIVSARPNNQDIKSVNHHLYGYVSGRLRYNVEKWCNDATKKIKNLLSKNLTPILVGGTGMYIDTLINGITSMPNIPESIKIESKNLFDKIGQKEFYNLVYSLDTKAVSDISKNDSQRLKRIWEVYNYTGKKFSTWKSNKNKKFLDIQDYKIFLFLPERNKNYSRVNRRAMNMIDSGAIQEIQRLLKLGFSKNLPIMKAHGVPEISSYLDGKIKLDECIQNIQLVTRHYVKRQNTWWSSSNLQIYRKFNEFPDEIDLKLTNLA